MCLEIGCELFNFKERNRNFRDFREVFFFKEFL